MSQFVTDTHPLVWHLTNTSRLSTTAKQVFTEADKGLYQIFVPAIVLIELVYLTEKGTVPKPLLQRMFELLEIPNGSYAMAPLDQAVIQVMANQVPWSVVPELADRIITATAVSLGLPLLTRDERIQQAGLAQIVW
jgi:PIN domain nuclease of toxin-antitoxin system